MRRYTITLGASTTAGGQVISASSCGKIQGMLIALEGDEVFCPACKTTGTIVCVDPRIPEKWNGKNVALENDHCACGCASPPLLIPNQSIRSQEIAGSNSKAEQDALVAKAMAPAATLFDDRFVLVDDETGLPLKHLEYAIRRESGDIEYGKTDDAGFTHLLKASLRAESVEIFF